MGRRADGRMKRLGCWVEVACAGGREMGKRRGELLMARDGAAAR